MNLLQWQREFTRAIALDAPCSLLENTAERQLRLGIYQKAYALRLVDALRHAYPVLMRVLGDERFDALAADYLKAYPSAQASIRWFGDALPEFVASHAEHVPHPSVVDVARMEWNIALAFDAPDAAALSFDDLKGVAPEAWPSLQCRAHPSVRMLRMSYAVEPVWQALSRDPEAVTDAPMATSHDLLIWRSQLAPHWRSLEPEEGSVLSACLAGVPFAQWCETLAGYGDDAPMRAAAYLRRWVDDGLLCAAPAS